MKNRNAAMHSDALNQWARLNNKMARLMITVAVITLLCGGCELVSAQRKRLANRVSSSVTGATKSSRTTPRTVTLKSGDDLQAAINEAIPGDTIALTPGAVFKGDFTLPDKGASEAFIVIRTAARDADLPASEERLDPARYGKLLPVIRSEHNNVPAITATNGAHHYGFFGIEFASTPNGGGNIVLLGTTEEKTVDQLPHHIEFDRCYFHGDPQQGQRRGIALNGRDTSIRNSYFSDFKRQGEESQAIAGWNGPGPFEITNNYIEAAAEGVIFGGADTPLRVVPTDIVISRNHFNKPLKWRNENWLVKNHLELKNAQRVLIDRNLMTNNWGNGQDGTAIQFTTREQEPGNKHITIADVVFSNNRISGAGGGINVYGVEGRGGHRLTIKNNVFEDIDGGKWNGTGKFSILTEWDTLVIENNTILHTGNITSAYGKPITGFVFRNNIVAHNQYGFHGDNAGGQLTLDMYFPDCLITNNVIINGNPNEINQRNFYLPSLANVGFVDAANGNFQLRADSSVRKLMRNGNLIGADMTAIPSR